MCYIKCLASKNPTDAAKKKETTSKILLSRTVSNKQGEKNNNNKMAWPKVKMFLIRFIYTKCQQLMVGQWRDRGRSGKYQSQVLADKQAYNGQQTNMQPFWNNNASTSRKNKLAAKEVNIM